MSLEDKINEPSQNYNSRLDLYYCNPDGTPQEIFDDELITSYFSVFDGERIKHYAPNRPNTYLYPFRFLVTNSDGVQKRIRLYATASTMISYIWRDGVWNPGYRQGDHYDFE